MENSNIKNWHALKLEDITKEFKSDVEKGLTSKEAAEKQRSFGLNKLPEGKKKAWYQHLWEQIKSPLIYILLFAGFLTFLLQEYIDTAVIVSAVIVNVAIGFWQEYRSENIFEKLQELVKIKAQVRRDGELHDVDSKEIVPGDIILLHIGMKVPADARLISAKDLEVNEAILTGESMPVKKDTGLEDEDTSLADRKNMVHTGTTIEKGEGLAIVVATGEHTELGQIAKLTASVEQESTPLQERLAKLSKRIALLVLFFAVVILVIGVYEHHIMDNVSIFDKEVIVEMFTLAVAVAVAAIPEGLPAALSIVLAVASQRILKKKGLVKTLIGAETLGSTTVICTDKTGTLTEGKMKVDKLHRVNDEDRAALILALANEAQVTHEGISGEATDKAKLQFFIDRGGDIGDVLEKYPRKALFPFDPSLKLLASFHKEGKSVKTFVTGAPEVLLDLSKISSDDKKNILEEVNGLASKGFRLIAMAENDLGSDIEVHENNNKELKGYIKDLEFVGIAAIRDPIRNEVAESVAQSRKSGIRIIMITGDHKLTAQSIGSELGFSAKEENILEGVEVGNMSAEELAHKIKSIEIISRASPEHKMKLVEALRHNGEVVAMTGDGVNDAPALKNADVGISLGAGTDVTKEAADLVLVDDSFSTITAAIKQGRIAFDNIRKVAIFVLSNSFTEIMLVLTSLILRIPLAITAVQILWANLVEDGLPSIALAFEPGEKDIMDRKPLKRKEPILDKTGLYIVFVVGILSNLILVGLFLSLYYLTNWDTEKIQTVMFAAVATDTLIYVFSIKTLHRSIFKSNILNNKFLVNSLLIGFVLMFMSVYVPILNTFLGTVPLGLIGMGLALSSGISRLLFIEAVKWWLRKKEILKASHHHVIPEESTVVQ